MIKINISVIFAGELYTFWELTMKTTGKLLYFFLYVSNFQMSYS